MGVEIVRQTTSLEKVEEFEVRVAQSVAHKVVFAVEDLLKVAQPARRNLSLKLFHLTFPFRLNWVSLSSAQQPTEVIHTLSDRVDDGHFVVRAGQAGLACQVALDRATLRDTEARSLAIQRDLAKPQGLAQFLFALPVAARGWIRR